MRNRLLALSQRERGPEIANPLQPGEGRVRGEDPRRCNFPRVDRAGFRAGQSRASGRLLPLAVALLASAVLLLTRREKRT